MHGGPTAVQTARPGGRRKAAWAALVVTLLTTLAGCASAPQNQVDAAPTRYVEAPTVSAAAQQAYGDRAGAAYEELSQWALRQWLVPTALDPSNTGDVDDQVLSAGITPQLAPALVPHWHTLIAAARTGNTAARDEVQLLRFHGVTDTRLTLGPSPVVSQAVTGGRVEVGSTRADGVVPLVVAFNHAAVVGYLAGRQPYPMDLSKDISYTVIPAEQASTPTATAGTATPSPGDTVNPNATWLIASYDGEVGVEFPESPTAASTGRTRSRATG